jgi:hypothetical protein
MLTLSAVKTEWGVSASDTNNDVFFKTAIRQVVSRIRQRTDRGIAWVTDSITASGTTALVEVIGHGWRTGQVVWVESSNCTPTINGARTITRIDDDHVTIPSVTITTDGTFATLHPQVTKEIVALSSSRIWIPEQVTPFLSVSAVYDRLSDDSWELVDDEDYEVGRDCETQKAIEIIRLTGSYTQGIKFPRGQYALRARSRTTTVKVVLYTGTTIIPNEIVMAGISMASDLVERRGRGKDEASYSFEGVSRSAMTGDERMANLLSPDSILASWQAR